MQARPGNKKLEMKVLNFPIGAGPGGLGRMSQQSKVAGLNFHRIRLGQLRLNRAESQAAG